MNLAVFIRRLPREMRFLAGAHTTRPGRAPHARRSRLLRSAACARVAAALLGGALACRDQPSEPRVLAAPASVPSRDLADRMRATAGRVPSNAIAGLTGKNLQFIFQHDASGQVFAWSLRDGLIVDTRDYGAVPAVWGLLGATDFQPDGIQDLVWTHTSTSAIIGWVMNSGDGVATAVELPAAPDPWRLVAGGDVNRDGRPDAFWRHPITGELVFWIVNGSGPGGVPTSFTPISLGAVPTEWQLESAGDLDGDGVTDLFWSHASAARRLVWLMDGASVRRVLDFGVVPAPWAIVAVADYDDDGKNDLVWQNRNDCSITVWLMDGARWLRSVSPGSPPCPWRLRAVRRSGVGLLGASVASVAGRQLLVQRRNPDGSLSPAAPYFVRGVNWSPASRQTQTYSTDPNNANVRRPEFAAWAATDVPLIAGLHANTARLFIDPGVDFQSGPAGLRVLDALYAAGVMVIMTVDDGANDVARARRVVAYYKNHPAVLMWQLGNELNINRYYGVASSVEDAVQRTETAAAIVKSLDPNHPVVASYGDIDINAPGMRLADTQRYVNVVAPSVDLWEVNVYRGGTFGSLFQDWASISAKPLLIGEYGTDAFRSTSTTNPPPGAVDEATQAAWNTTLWSDIYRNRFTRGAGYVAAGGSVFELTDEWWKVAPAGSQERSGFALPGGHPDSFANEEWFGLADIDRRPRQAYRDLAALYDPGATPPPVVVTLRDSSAGYDAFSATCGYASLGREGASFFRGVGCTTTGARGFNLAVIDPATGLPRPGTPARNYDTWAGAAAKDALVTALANVPPESVVMLAVADDPGITAGTTAPSNCTPSADASTTNLLAALDALGSTRIRSYCFRGSWALITRRLAGGQWQLLGEQLSAGTPAVVQTALTLP